MKNYLLLLLVSLAVGCAPSTSQPSDEPHDSDTPEPRREVMPAFGEILAEADLTGCVLIYHAAEDVFYSNDFGWAEVGRLPASTFKIPNSMIGLETGVVEDANTLFEWDGKPRRLKSWEADLTFRQAYLRSCVPCYQQVAREVGPARMRRYLDKFDYGNMVFDSSGVDMFWLEGESQVSCFDQIDFLHRFNEGKLSISSRTDSLMRDLMVLDETETYTLRGKTGWAIRNGHNNGWFVGFIQTEGDVYYFATNVDPNEDFNMDLFPRIRSQVTMAALDSLGVI